VGVLIFFMLAFGALVFVPLLLLKLVFSLAFLPFRLVGLAFRLVFGALGGLFRVGFGLVGLVAGILAMAFFVVLLPLLPLLVVGGFVWLLTRLVRPRPAVRLIA
jgi:hypothetical protein